MVADKAQTYWPRLEGLAPWFLRNANCQDSYELLNQYYSSLLDSPEMIMTRSESAGRAEEKPENWWEFCPLCGSKLHNHRCRFVCPNPRCRFFMSCSEFDL